VIPSFEQAIAKIVVLGTRKRRPRSEALIEGTDSLDSGLINCHILDVQHIRCDTASIDFRSDVGFRRRRKATLHLRLTSRYPARDDTLLASFNQGPHNRTKPAGRDERIVLSKNQDIMLCGRDPIIVGAA
jgi:hypothetical protein